MRKDGMRYIDGVWRGKELPKEKMEKLNKLKSLKK
jgi:hypothetical protein